MNRVEEKARGSLERSTRWVRSRSKAYSDRSKTTTTTKVADARVEQETNHNSRAAAGAITA